jgi:hypothetical protein
MRKSAFVVGRANGRGTLLLFVGEAQVEATIPIAGPWTVRAVVSTN